MRSFFAGALFFVGFFVGCVVGLTACGGPPSEDTPSGALRLFFESMSEAQEVAGADRVEALEQAFDLLDAESRSRLTARARTAGALGGREPAACEMLAAYPSRGEGVPTSSANFRETITGDTAVVTVHLEGESTIDVPMVREEDGWRVVLGVPELIAE